MGLVPFAGDAVKKSRRPSSTSGSHRGPTGAALRWLSRHPPPRRDLQYTLSGKRHYRGYDTAASDRGSGHAVRIGANDPTARIHGVELITQNEGPPVTALAARPSARPFVCGAP